MYCKSDSKKWYIIDRKKELIKVRGFQVAPGEIEGVLLSHPQVLEAAVIGIQNLGDLDSIEHPRAYLVRRAGPKARRWTKLRSKNSAARGWQSSRNSLAAFDLSMSCLAMPPGSF